MRIILSIVSAILTGVFTVNAQTYQSVADLILQCEQTARTKVASSQASYGKELDDLKNSYQSKGELENLVAVKKEQDRFKKDGIIQEASIVKSPEALRKLQIRYKETGQQVARQYLKELEAKKKALTVEGKVDLAMGFKDAIEKIQVQYAVAGALPTLQPTAQPSEFVSKYLHPNGSFCFETFANGRSTHETGVRGKWKVDDGKLIINWDNGTSETVQSPTSDGVVKVWNSKGFQYELKKVSP